jgi:hypothetical protein
MRAASIALLLLLQAASGAATGARLPPHGVMTAGVALSYALSQPLRDMQPSTERRAPPASIPAAPLIADFEGINIVEVNGGGCLLSTCASDDSGAIGRHYFVQTVNVDIAVYDRAGQRIAGPVSTATFWYGEPDCDTEARLDSVVIYDREADRWVVSRPGGRDGGALCVAVSQTADPTGRWHQYAFRINTESNGLAHYFNDYPKIGVWPDAYFVTANPSNIREGIGNTVTALNRAAMLAGVPMPPYVTFFVPAPREIDRVPAHSHMLAATLDGERRPPAGAPGYVVQVQDSHLGFPAGRLQIYEIRVDWSDPFAATLLPTQGLVPEPFNSNACPGRPCITQPGGAALLSLSFGYMMQPLVYRNFGDREVLLFNQTVAADGDPSVAHAGIRWYELRRGAGRPWAIAQQGTYAPDARQRWLGSIAMNRDHDIALGFSVAGPGQYVSIHYAGRRRGDPPGTLPRGEFSIIEGKGAQLGIASFGDYSQMSVDPLDDCTFWYTNTYYPATTSPNRWHTRVAAFRLGACSGASGR